MYYVLTMYRLFLQFVPTIILYSHRHESLMISCSYVNKRKIVAMIIITPVIVLASDMCGILITAYLFYSH